MPLNPAVVLVGRLKIISVLAVSISLFGIFLLLYEMYRVAREFTRNAQLDRENQLLAMESRRYMELQTYLDNTRRLRHDFRQHLHVIAGLTETGQLEELKSYLHQYESELSEHRPACAPMPPWMHWPDITTMQPGSRAFLWSGSWHCLGSFPCRRPTCAPFWAICWKTPCTPVRSCRRSSAGFR